MPSKNKKNNAEPLKKVKKQSKANKLKQEIKSQKNDLEDQKDRYLRLKAEFDNYRRRKQKEVIDLLKYDGESVIKQFLSVLDDLDRLAIASEENGINNIEKIKEGINLILNKINKRFEELEVVSFTKPGDIVNPELHDALMMRTEDGKDENEILEVFEKGYRYKDKVIRHAKVVVNQTPS
jgi:molecular chaperone GrpE|tara:strand:- start:779 stop:1318 length:540 start_codon:yes stop_codon:yes gene_type:complete